jgi:signal peptidase I
MAADVYIIARNRTKNTIGFRAFRLITSSMAPTLQVGDSFILDMNYYKKNEIQRGNLISFIRENYSGPLCKRVIGLPGEKVEGKGERVYVNGVAIAEPYAHYLGRNAALDSFNRQHQRSDFGPLTVPEGMLFVMGDNRDNSYDSRDPDFGFVPVDSVWAKPLYIYFSTDRSRIGRTLK